MRGHNHCRSKKWRVGIAEGDTMVVWRGKRKVLFANGKSQERLKPEKLGGELEMAVLQRFGKKQRGAVFPGGKKTYSIRADGRPVGHKTERGDVWGRGEPCAIPKRERNAPQDQSSEGRVG